MNRLLRERGGTDTSLGDEYFDSRVAGVKLFSQYCEDSTIIYFSVRYICVLLAKDKVNMSQQKRDKFVRLAEARVSKAMQAIRLVGNLNNRSAYDYSEDDLKKIVKALNAEVDAMAARFRQTEGRSRPEFKL